MTCIDFEGSFLVAVNYVVFLSDLEEQKHFFTWLGLWAAEWLEGLGSREKNTQAGKLRLDLTKESRLCLLYYIDPNLCCQCLRTPLSGYHGAQRLITNCTLLVCWLKGLADLQAFKLNAGMLLMFLYNDWVWWNVYDNQIHVCHVL